MNSTVDARAAQLMSSPVLAVTVERSLAAAWAARRIRSLHRPMVLDRYGVAAVLESRTLAESVRA